MAYINRYHLNQKEIKKNKVNKFLLGHAVWMRPKIVKAVSRKLKIEKAGILQVIYNNGNDLI